MAARFRSVGRDKDEQSSNKPDTNHASSSSPGSDYFDKVVSSSSAATSQVDTSPDVPLDKAQVLSELERICASSAFHGSRRSQQFLRFIVLQTLDGHGDELKERVIATEVFGRGTDFEPGEDSLVRVKARELRKRLGSFYKTDSELTCRIEIPLGGYTPRFIPVHCPILATQDPPASVSAAENEQLTPAPSHWSRRKLLWTSASLLGGLAIGAGAIWQKQKSSASCLDELWKPIFQTEKPLVIFIPVLKERATQKITDRIGIGPARALSKVAGFLDSHRYPYSLRFGSEMNFAVLKEQPSLLLGGLSSAWTALMTKGLRFTLQWDQQQHTPAITDSSTGKSWVSVNPTSQGYADMDYGLLTRLFDRDTGQISMIAGGRTTFGTEAAAEILSNAADFGLVLESAPANWQQMNFQVVVQTAIVGTTPSHPQIVAVHFW